MTTHNVGKYVLKVLSGLFPVMFSLMSCTYDYFVDENNFRLYVPQIEDGSIQSLYVAFHAEDGGHVITREVTAPFDRDDLMKQGILRFKLPPGRNYHVSCFADYAPASITAGNPFDESYKAKTPADESVARNPQDHVYLSRTTDPRSLFMMATAYPMGHPDSRTVVTANIENSRRFKGKVVLSFKDLPPMVTRIDTYYGGLATGYYFDGTFRHATDTDRIMGSYNVADYRQGNIVTITDIINPSAGTDFGRPTTTLSASTATGSALAATRVVPPPANFPSTPAPVELEVVFFDVHGSAIGTITFTEEDFNNLDDSKKPQDENGVTRSSLVLRSQETVKFEFSGFTILGVDLKPWDDIIVGPVTPM